MRAVQLLTALSISSRTAGLKLRSDAVKPHGYIDADATGEVATSDGYIIQTAKLPPHPYDHLLAVPELKLLFCKIEKNAGTQFSQLINDLNGIANIPGEIQFASSVVVNNWTYELIEQRLHDPTWTKVVFLRDPLERLVSAYRNKCESPVWKSDADHCLDKNFSKTVSMLQETDDRHYAPQGEFCGGLKDMIGEYDFVGHVTQDYKEVAKEVREMMHLVLRRNRQIQLQDSQANMMNRQERMLDNATMTYFSSHGEESTNGLVSHTTGTKGGESYYEPATVRKALKFYSRDYDLLPGLKIPKWARRMRSVQSSPM